jgi:hypothetical protein
MMTVGFDSLSHTTWVSTVTTERLVSMEIVPKSYLHMIALKWKSELVTVASPYAWRDSVGVIGYEDRWICC